jgi:hypothetical protein
MSETPHTGWEPPEGASGTGAWQPPPSESPFAQRGEGPAQPQWQQPTQTQFVHPGGRPAGTYGSAQAESSGKATASLVLGICGLVVCPLICSILALVFGYQGRSEIDKSGGRLAGRGNATAGIVLGWIGIVICLLGIIALIVLAATGNFDTTYYEDGAGEI